MTFGRFTVTLLQRPARAVALHRRRNRHAARPARVRANAYLEGTSFAVLIEHDGRRLLVNARLAETVPGALAGRRADVVFLGIGLLGRQPPALHGGVLARRRW